MEISYDDFMRLSKELTDKEVCINQLRNDLNATRKELESEKLQSVLRKYILLSKEKIAVTGTVPCQHEGAKRPEGRDATGE